jgi:hypothetical protein
MGTGSMATCHEECATTVNIAAFRAWVLAHWHNCNDDAPLRNISHGVDGAHARTTAAMETNSLTSVRVPRGFSRIPHRTSSSVRNSSVSLVNRMALDRWHSTLPRRVRHYGIYRMSMESMAQAQRPLPRQKQTREPHSCFVGFHAGLIQHAQQHCIHGWYGRAR